MDVVSMSHKCRTHVPYTLPISCYCRPISWHVVLNPPYVVLRSVAIGSYFARREQETTADKTRQRLRHVYDPARMSCENPTRMLTMARILNRLKFSRSLPDTSRQQQRYGDITREGKMLPRCCHDVASTFPRHQESCQLGTYRSPTRLGVTGA